MSIKILVVDSTLLKCHLNWTYGKHIYEKERKKSKKREHKSKRESTKNKININYVAQNTYIS